jgi:hypothetical protein
MNLTTHECVKLIAEHLKNRLEWVDQIKWLARKDPTSVITDGREWMGLNDKLGNNGYFRYFGMYDHEYSSAKLVSAKTDMVTATIRFVFMHKCENEDELEMSLWNELTLAPFRNGSPEYKVQVTRSSKDKQGIFLDETDAEQGSTDLAWNLMAFDLKVSYKVVMNTDPNCIPKCDEC